MPRVSVPENQVGLAQPTQARFVPADNGGGVAGAIGSGLTAIGKDVGQFAEQEVASQHIYNEAAAKQAYNTADEATRQLLYTGDNAYYKQTGFGAVGAQKPTMDALAKVRSDAYGALKNPQQQRMFADAFDKRLGAEQQGIATHANQQLVVEGNRQSEARQTGRGTTRPEHQRPRALWHLCDDRGE